jgi:hypothetical protein
MACLQARILGPVGPDVVQSEQGERHRPEVPDRGHPLRPDQQLRAGVLAHASV